METQTSVAPSETWLRDDLGEHLRAALQVPRERHAVGDEQRGLVDDAGVRNSGARSHRLRAVVGAARLHGQLCENSLKAHLHGFPLRGFSWYTMRNKDDLGDGVPTDQLSHNRCESTDSHCSSHIVASCVFVLLVSTLITRRPRRVPSTMSTSPGSSARTSLVSLVTTHITKLPSRAGSCGQARATCTSNRSQV